MSSAYWLAHSGIAVVGRTPPRVRHMVASTVTSASYLGWRSKRLITQENMAVVLGLPYGHQLVRRTALSSWSKYGRTAASLVCLPYVDLTDVDARMTDLTVGAQWHEYLRAAMAPGKGTVITTGHFGSWDLAGAIAAQHVPLSAVADTFKDERLNALLQGHRREKSVDVIPVTAPRRILRALNDGRAVAIVVDRPVSERQGVEVTFFGRRTFVPAGSAALAVKTGAAIMPGYMWFAPGGGYYIRTFPALFPRTVGSSAERAAEIQRLTQYMLDCQEEVVRHSPAQWFMFRRFWPAAFPAPAALQAA
ncbi:lysophospholipid acyltransferase family protein [Paractinoplanes lichenicola]|uniref:Lysophospholipid acyltransferase family protein n=1 Tax=Paractinoplanes lichenicola TaxID=2802976 RepID=A0ABS1VP54_9ACTN|nr:lysophospholipid acyltransferase family protein [Actinoplanes lichenicola]MBL7256266.1 lysophospholipid acyltransferase family protein [Actinoplanes lichenicola]